MKKFRLLNAALMVILLGIGFSACSKMDNEEPLATEKKLVKKTFESNSQNMYMSDSHTYSYYDDGRLKETTVITKIMDRTSTYTNKYIWDTYSVSVTETTMYNGEPMDSKFTMHITDGHVKAITYDDYPTESVTFKYNTSNRIANINDGRNDINCIWDNDKLMSIKQVSVNDESAVTLTYGEPRQVKGYSPLVPIELSLNPIFIAHPELFGMKTSQIYETRTKAWSDMPEKANCSHFTYEFDKDGYISKITYTNKINEVDTGTVCTYNFTWE